MKLVLGRGDVVVLGGTFREPAGGGKGGKLDSGSGDGTTDGRVEDEGISTDEVARRGAWVRP